MPENPALRAEASNPSTDPARLAAIAAESPELGAVVAANPAAYDGLLDWLAQYGDAAAQQAVAVRRGAPAPAAPPAAPAAPAAAVAAPFTAPKPKAPLSAGARKGLLFGGIGLVAVAAIAVIAVVVVNILGGGSSSATIQTAQITSEPRDDAWELISPLAEDADDEETLSAEVFTVGQDRALVRWVSSDQDPLVSMVDTRGGSILWTIDDFEDYFEVVSAPGANPILLQASDGSDDYNYDVLYAVDAGSGEVISDSSDLDSAYPLLERTPYAAEDLLPPGDVLLSTEDGVGLYPTSALDEEKWFIDIDEDSSVRLAGNRIIVDGEEAYDARTGEEVDWDGDEDLEYFGLKGRIFGVDGSMQYGGDLFAFSDSGEELWDTDFTGYLFYYDSQRIGFFDEEEGELQMIDISTGEELWTQDVDYNDGYTYGFDEASGALVLPAGKEDEATVFDLATGDERFSFDAAEDGDWSYFVIGMTPAAIYITGGSDGDLIALDAREGDELWSLSGDDDLVYRLAGGNLVSITRVDGEDGLDDAVLRGLQP